MGPSMAMAESVLTKVFTKSEYENLPMEKTEFFLLAHMANEDSPGFCNSFLTRT